MTAPTAKDVEGKLVREIATIMAREPADIGPDVPLHTLGIDSMSFVEILVFIEKTFNLKLIETGLTRADFQTVGALAARISKECCRA
jgi:acyl carrier protein